MENNYEINFFIRCHISEEKLISAINSFFEIGVETVNFPVENSRGYVVLTKYKGAFKLGAVVLWPAEFGDFNCSMFGGKLAKALSTEVLIDDSDASGWLLADAGGDIEIVNIVDSVHGVDVLR